LGIKTVGLASKSSKKAAKMPAGLCPSAKRLWIETVSSWEVDDVAALTHLGNACRSLTRLRKLEGILAKDGIMIAGRFKQQTPHPAHKLLMAEARNFREHMQALQLDIESLYSDEEEG
jgi:phage terminase small subunit